MTLDLKYYLSIFWRRLPYFLVVAVTVSAVGLSIAAILPAKYRAEATLLVEGQQIPGNLAASTVSTSASEQIQIIQRRLMTRANILDIVNRLDIYPADNDMSTDEIVVDMRRRATIQLRGGRGGATTVSVGFLSDRAVQAAEVTNELATLILQENVELRSGRATQTLEFFEQEVARLGSQLDTQNAAILAFKLENQNALPESLDYRRTRQTAQQERLLQLQREEATLLDRRTKLVELYNRTGEVQASAAEQSPEQQRLRAAQDELSQALSIYSETNPRVRLLKARIEALERAANGVEAAPDDTSERDQVLSVFELQLSDLEGQLAYVRDQKTVVEAELEELSTTIDQTPRNAIRLGELNRDFENTQAQYNLAISRLSAAQTGERIELTSKGERISLLDQAVVPSQPYSPDRRKISIASVAGGLGLGLALIVAMEFLNGAIRRPVDISNKLGITPIATLPYIFTRRQLIWRRVVVLTAVLIIAIGVPAALWSLHTYYLPIDMLLAKVLDKTGLGPLLDRIRAGIADGLAQG